MSHEVRSHEPQAVGLCDRLSATVDAQLREDVLDVRPDCPWA
jgi:hypothetical protein